MKHEEFIAYLEAQVGQPYVLGGQHTKLTPDNYHSVIAKREHDDAENIALVESYCEKKFKKGDTELYGYDCSGLGMYWLQNLEHIYGSDMNANSMMKTCEIRADAPQRGWWVFRKDDTGKATHIGYMLSDKELIEAKGRKYGVVVSKFAKKNWSVWGIPSAFAKELKPEAEPVEDLGDEMDGESNPEDPSKKIVLIKGGSVNVRSSGSTEGKVVGTVHRGETYALVGIDAETGWYEILRRGVPVYITNKSKYTELIE